MSAATVLVTVGTDHHPFDRLVHWADDWAVGHPEIEVFVQHGTATAPRIAHGAPLVDPIELHQRVAAARVVVTHGGLSSIMETRAAGLLPVVVARDPERGEHVDGHQLAFTAHQHRLGRIALVGSEVELAVALHRAIADPGAYRLPTGAGDVTAAVDEVAVLVDDLLRRRPARHRRKAQR